MAFNQPFLPQNFENFSYPCDIATSNFDSFLWKGAQNDLVKLQCFTWVWYCMVSQELPVNPAGQTHRLLETHLPPFPQPLGHTKFE